MAKKYRNRKGEERTWYSPNERRRKYSKDVRYKTDSESGGVLSSTQLAYRSGYLKRSQEEIDMYYLKNQDKYREKYGEEKYKERFGKRNSVSKPSVDKSKNKRKKETVQQDFLNQLGN